MKGKITIIADFKKQGHNFHKSYKTYMTSNYISSYNKAYLQWFMNEIKTKLWPIININIEQSYLYDVLYLSPFLDVIPYSFVDGPSD